MLKRLENANRAAPPRSQSTAVELSHPPVTVDDTAGSRLLSRLESYTGSEPSSRRSPARSRASSAAGPHHNQSRSGLSGTVASRQKEAFEKMMLEKGGIKLGQAVRLVAASPARAPPGESCPIKRTPSPAAARAVSRAGSGDPGGRGQPAPARKDRQAHGAGGSALEAAMAQVHLQT